VVGFVGTFGPWHGIPQLTQAIDKILKEQLLPDTHFLLMGDGRFRPEMERQIGYSRDVTFTGTVPYSEIQDYLAICDVLVSPHNPQVDGGEFFGSPTKVFEYMAMGKGIVASNLGQIGEILSHGSAILVEPGTVKELTQGIIKLVMDEDLRKQLGKRARERVVANYTWEKNTSRLIQASKHLSTTK
jgi:glycosyltransferase involved in cell wall biosynthesis